MPRSATAEAEGPQSEAGNRGQQAGAAEPAAASSEATAVASQQEVEPQDLQQPISSSSRASTSYDQGASSSILSSSRLNQSTVSLDLDDLPPIQLPKPLRSLDIASSMDEPAPPSLPPASVSLDELEKYRPPKPMPQVRGPAKSKRPDPKKAAAGSRQSSMPAPAGSGSWDNLQPLFRPAARAEPKAGPMDPPHEAAAADVLFAAIQNRRYKHVKGTSYKDATFALVPLDRKVGAAGACQLHCFAC